MFKNILKKNILVLLGIIFIQVAVFGANPIHIEIDGARQVIPADKGAPYVNKGVTMVPLTFISEKLGHQVGWTKSTQTVTINGGEIVLKINDYNAYVNNNSIRLDTPPVVKNGRTYVPLRFIASQLGVNVDYKNNTVMIGKSGSASNSGTGSKNPSVSIETIMKSEGYVLDEYKTADVTNDGIKDYIAVGKKSWEAYLLMVDGATGNILATQKVVAGEYGCSIDVDSIDGGYHIIYTPFEKIPTQGLFEFKNGKFTNHSKTLNEQFDIKPDVKTSMMVVYPDSTHNQGFTLAADKYRALMNDTDWYPMTIAEIKNTKLEVSRDIIFPEIGNLEQFRMIEYYTWNGTAWKLDKVSYEDYKSDFTKSATNNTPAKNEPTDQSKNILEWIGEGKIDILPGKIGDHISEATKVLGVGETYMYQGGQLHDYGNYGIAEDPYSSKITYYTFVEGFKLYGFTVGDDAKTIESKVGKYHTKHTLDSEDFGGFSRPIDTVYRYDYVSNGYRFYIEFDKNNRSVYADFYGN